MIRLAGSPVEKRLVLELATQLRRADYAHLADTLEGATVANLEDIPLTCEEQTAILSVLDDPRDGLEELRVVLSKSTSGGRARAPELRHDQVGVHGGPPALEAT